MDAKPATVLFLVIFASIGCDASRRASDGAGPVVLRDPGSGPCPHSFFPLVEGARWSYELGEGERHQRTKAEIEVLKVTKRGAGHVAEVRRRVGTSELRVEALCESKGVSFLGVFVPLGPPIPGAHEVPPRTTERRGALLPSPSELRSGAEWTYGLTAHTELRGRKILTMDSLWSVEAAWLRKAAVTVPAGRYEVTQVSLKVSVHHRPPEEEDIMLSDRMMDPPTMPFTYSLAKGVGVVQIEGGPIPDRPGVRARWELTGVSVRR
jgi:hypothetical protein